MTSISTLISPIMTPLLTYLILGQSIAFDPVGMFISIVQIVIIPIILGLAVKKFLPALATTANDYLPAVSSISISLLIAGIIGASLGFAIGKLTGMSWKQMVAVSIEVGMQNSGLATGLAKVHFASMPLAGVPGAVFSAWHNISGAVLAYVYSNYLNKRFDSHYGEDV